MFLIAQVEQELAIWDEWRHDVKTKLEETVSQKSVISGDTTLF